MPLDALKPVLATLALPPALPLLMLLAGLWLLWWRRAERLASWLVCAGLLSAWLLSCNAVAVLLSQALLPQIAPATPALLKTHKVQAIVVLGGGMQRSAIEYGEPQLSASSLVRLRYGAWLARRSAVPLAFSGGVGWASDGTPTPPEAAGAQAAVRDFGVELRWSEGSARDTAENARLSYALLHPQGVQRIALVTHSWHMPRAMAHFQEAGFTVLPAPTAYLQTEGRTELEWLPSGEGLTNNRTVLREWLGMQVGRLGPYWQQVRSGLGSASR